MPSGFAQETAPTEYQIKAAFIYNFAKFVEWPADAFSTDTAPITIGVLGDNVFGDNLERTIQNKVINNHPFAFRAFRSIADITNCQILFISRSEKKHLPQILGALQKTSTLTVSEMDQFIQSGGMINFVIEEERIHFEINNENAKKSGLKISSKLLGLAVHSH